MNTKQRFKQIIQEEDRKVRANLLEVAKPHKATKQEKDKAYGQGWNACMNGKSDKCPYKNNMVLASAWNTGYSECEQDQNNAFSFSHH